MRLRVEDHDRERARPEYETSLLADLEWLGLEPDEPPLASFHPDARQSNHPQRYEAALGRLDAAGLVYWCDCSRQRIHREVPPAHGELRYDGHCRDRGLGPGPNRGVRVRVAPGVECFDDLRVGLQEHAPADQCGDVLVRDRIGQWTYQFAVTVDDLVEGVSHVIRGRDLLASTGRQIRLARLLGRIEPPHFLHHPLILGPDGEKLSKSKRDTGLRDLRNGGVSPARAFGMAAAGVGLIDTPREVHHGELADLVARDLTTHRES